MNTNTHSENSRLNRYCKFMAWLTLIPILSTVIGCASPFLFYFFNMSNIGLESGNYSFFVSTITDVDPNKLVLWQAALATLIDSLPIAILVYAFHQLRLLFLSYSQSQYFTVNSANHCYNVGKALVLWVIVRFLSEPILTIILSFNNDPNERFFSITFTGDDMMTLFPAMSIMIIGQILKKACQIAEENRQFI